MSDQPEDTGYLLIDPPVGPYSGADEIRRWIAELETMPQMPGVPKALREARAWLATAREDDDE